jgi:hypothetical protein
MLSYALAIDFSAGMLVIGNDFCWWVLMIKVKMRLVASIKL